MPTRRCLDRLSAGSPPRFAAFALLALLGGWIVGATASRLLGAPPCVGTPPANLCGWLADAWSWL